jgi:hypothetical protein
MVTAIAAVMIAEVVVPQTALPWWRRWGDPMMMAPEARYGAAYGGYPRPAYPPYPGGYGAPGPYGAPPPAYPGYGAAEYGQPAAPPPYQQPYAYPQRGQSPQQSADEFRACQTWASTQTGFNPAAPTATAAGPSGPSAGASLIGGGARGAAVGAVGGAIGGDAGKGAAIGAAVGGLFSLMRRREEQKAFEQQEQAATQSTLQKSDAYNRALDACMSSRGYTVR